MTKKPPEDLKSSAVSTMEDLLAYRLPQSGKALGSIVLSRAHAEEILQEIYHLRQRNAQHEAVIIEWSQARNGSPSVE